MAKSKEKKFTYFAGTSRDDTLGAPDPQKYREQKATFDRMNKPKASPAPATKSAAPAKPSAPKARPAKSSAPKARPAKTVTKPAPRPASAPAPEAKPVAKSRQIVPIPKGQAQTAYANPDYPYSPRHRDNKIGRITPAGRRKSKGATGRW